MMPIKWKLPRGINPEHSLEGLMLKLKLQYFGHLRTDSLEKTLMLGKIAEQVLEAKSLPQGTSAPLTELVALTRALELSKG